MENNWSEEVPFPSMKRVAQINDYFCGPAVLRMLLSFWGVRVLQKEIVERCNFDVRKIENEGLNLLEMNRAVEKMAPQMQFWSKQNSEMEDVDKLVNQFHIPVGVEWQGAFEEYTVPGEEGGHFSVFTAISLEDNKLKIADPFSPFYEEDRVFTINHFERIWWDNNYIEESDGRRYSELDRKVMFVIIPKEEDFPEKMGMVKGVERGTQY